MEFRDDLITELLATCERPADVFGKDGLLKQLTGRLMERILEQELTSHLEAEKALEGAGNSRNGFSEKTVKTGESEVRLSIPRDRAGTFEPQLVKKHQRRLEGFDEKVISLYARGMTVREIQGHLAELYGTEVSPDLISKVTDAVQEDVREWQARRLEPVWLVVWVDALIVKVRDQGQVRNKAAYLAIGLGKDGKKEVLGLWLDGSEGAKHWLKVATDLKNRGVEDVLIMCCDGLKGLPEAFEAIFPKTVVQTCIVHMIRNSLRYVSYKDAKRVASALRPVYTAANAEDALARLDEFAAEWGTKCPMVVSIWKSHWERVTPFLEFSPGIRRVIYTTNTIESLNFQLRKIIKNRGHFPTDEAATKLLWLALERAQRAWTMPVANWAMAIHEFTLRFPDRIRI